MALEIDYSRGQWSHNVVDEYLNYTLDLLDLLNLVTSAISSLNQGRVSILHALSMSENSPSLKKIPGKSLSRDWPTTGIVPGTNDRRESDLLQALTVLKKIAFLAMGFILSGLWSDEKAYLEIREGIGNDDDPIVKALDSRLGEIQGGLAEVKQVNRAVSSADRELSVGLEALERSIQGVEKKANDLFSEVLAARNTLLDHIRLKAQNSLE